MSPLFIISVQRQRTVYRLTLVKAWNVEELQAYSELIALGQPDFIEVKVELNYVHILHTHTHTFNVIVTAVYKSLCLVFMPYLSLSKFFSELSFNINQIGSDQIWWVF